jgi:hypothetical protein
MPEKSLTPEQVLELLAETPRRIVALTNGVVPTHLQSAPAPNEWSANDVLAHLRACSDMWGNSIMTILAEEHPTIRAINPTTWMKQTDYPTLEFLPSFRAFAAQRADLSAVLESLPPEGWFRTATVTGAGKPIVRTVLSYAQRLAIHERPHLQQIGRIINTIGQ